MQLYIMDKIKEQEVGFKKSQFFGAAAFFGGLFHKSEHG